MLNCGNESKWALFVCRPTSARSCDGVISYIFIMASESVTGSQDLQSSSRRTILVVSVSAVCVCIWLCCVCIVLCRNQLFSLSGRLPSWSAVSSAYEQRCVWKFCDHLNEVSNSLIIRVINQVLFQIYRLFIQKASVHRSRDESSVWFHSRNNHWSELCCLLQDKHSHCRPELRLIK